ncbi:hypothetical protein K502DRAFT_358186 [Neoconidiobolus thromboides FSU 785]|nr:hypothetical protein K502DRAFT_358186 [Neoconidiobolus thromboides FSU 785]
MRNLELNMGEIGECLIDMITDEDITMDKIQNFIEKDVNGSIYTILNYKINQSEQLKKQFPKEHLKDAQIFLGLNFKDLNLIQFMILQLEEEEEELIIYFIKYLIKLFQYYNSVLYLDLDDFLLQLVFYQCFDKNTILHYASFFTMLDLVELLLKLGSNPNLKNCLKYTPVDCVDNNDLRNLFFNLSEQKNYFALKNKEQFLIKLINNNINNNNTMSSNNSSNTSLSSSKSILKYSNNNNNVNSSANSIKIKKKVQFDNNTLLTNSIKSKDILFIKQLISEQPSIINQLNKYMNYKNGDTLIHLCCRYQLNKLLNYFLKLNLFNINQLNYNSFTPFHIAIQMKDLNCINLLLNHPSFSKQINILNCHFNLLNLSNDPIILKLLTKLTYTVYSYNNNNNNNINSSIPPILPSNKYPPAVSPNTKKNNIIGHSNPVTPSHGGNSNKQSHNNKVALVYNINTIKMKNTAKNTHCHPPLPHSDPFVNLFINEP